MLPLRRLIAATLAVSLAAAPAMAQPLPDLGDVSDASISEAQERTLGKRIMMDIRSDPAYVEDAELSEYIAALGAKLVLASDTSRGDIEFFLIQDDAINAFALVGGFIGVYTGLILASQSESELAGVVGHEISHILQRHQARMIAGQKGAGLLSLAALAIAIMAARSSNSSQAPEAAMATAAGLQIQNQLNYSRDFEQEADRKGLTILERSSFDPRGMANFFERLQRANRHNDGTAPGYLRSHPLTTERIADMQNRVIALSVRNVSDSQDYQFARAKLRAQQGSPAEAVNFFRNLIAEKTVRRTSADVYGLALALKRTRDFAAAQKELDGIRAAGGINAWVEHLAADILSDQQKFAEAQKTLAGALKRFPSSRALFFALTESQFNSGLVDAPLDSVTERLRRLPDEPRLYDLQARGYALKNKQLAQHRALAEAYHRRGNLVGAIEQLELALKANDGDFYEKSGAEARSREFKAELVALKKDKNYEPKNDR